jgi:hypothetical protein
MKYAMQRMSMRSGNVRYSAFSERERCVHDLRPAVSEWAQILPGARAR